MDDSQIVQLYFSRSESSIEETAKKYGAYLSQVAFNILHSREDTEEIVADTYLAAWNQIPPTYPKVLRHFLSRITRNLSFDRLDYLTAKRRNQNMVTLLSELEECLPDRRGSAEDIWEAKQLGIILNRFLETLEPMDCKILLSRYYYSMPIQKIAEKTYLPERTVKYRLGKLRKQLRQYLSWEGILV